MVNNYDFRDAVLKNRNGNLNIKYDRVFYFFNFNIDKLHIFLQSLALLQNVRNTQRD